MSTTCESQGAVLPDLVNRLTSELAEMRRDLAAATRKLGTTTRTLEGRTQELTEARAALALLLATLDTTTDAIIAMGHFGRAMHYNTRFVEMWGIASERLPTLSDSALLAMQLSQVKDPEGFLSRIEERKASPDSEHTCLVEMTDGRVLKCRVVPHRVRGKRIGTVTSYHEITSPDEASDRSSAACSR